MGEGAFLALGPEKQVDLYAHIMGAVPASGKSDKGDLN